VWEDALTYYTDSYYGGHIHISNAAAERSVRGTSRMSPRPGSADHPIFIPSATSTPTKLDQKGKNVLEGPVKRTPNPPGPATPIRPSGNLGTGSNPIFVSSALPTPFKAPAVPDPATPAGRRFLAIDTALKAGQAPAVPSAQQVAPFASQIMPPASQPRFTRSTAATRVSKTKPRFVVTNESDDDDNTITGYFGTPGAGPSHLA